jgi:hypothetical protein
MHEARSCLQRRELGARLRVYVRCERLVELHEGDDRIDVPDEALTSC